MARYNDYLKEIDQRAFTDMSIVISAMKVESTSTLKFIFQDEAFEFDNGEIYHVLREGKKIVDAQIEGGKL